MDLIQILLVISAVFGIFLMVFTLIKFSVNEKSGAPSYMELENSIKAVDTSVEEAEKVVDELNKFSETVLSEIENKYKELLFVYNLIDEKKNDVIRLPQGTPADKPGTQTLTGEEKSADNPPRKQKIKPSAGLNPAHSEIINMYEQGIAIPEISKKMNMGQGEVKLILELAKAK